MPHDKYALFSNAVTAPVEQPILLEGVDTEYAGAAPRALSDSTDLAFISTGLHVAVAGSVRYTLKGQSANQYIEEALAVGWHPMRVKRVWATGTTATVRAYT